MLDIENRNYQPSERELLEYSGCPLLNELYDFLRNEYHALCKIEYSGDRVLAGWNMKLKKAGRTLCTLYPREGYFKVLVVVGAKEKERTQALLPSMSDAFRDVYRATPEGMGQRWLLFELRARAPLYEDILRVIRIRRETR